MQQVNDGLLFTETKLFKHEREGGYSSIGRTMDCGSRGWGFKSPYLPMHGFWRLTHQIAIKRHFDLNKTWYFVVELAPLLTLLHSRTALLWQEGLLIDFLQKKLVDRWLRAFVITSANLFSDKVAFEFVYRVYILLFLDQLFRFNGGDYDTVAGLFTAFLGLFLMLFTSLTLWYVLIKWVNCH